MSALESNFIAQDYTEVSDRGRFVQAKRPDGLMVFFDIASDEISKCLNHVRAYGTRMDVYDAIWILRGAAISLNYAKRHGTQCEVDFINAKIRTLCEEKIKAISATKQLAADNG